MLNRVLVVAANMTGDMFGIAAGLLLDTKLGVLILDEVDFDASSGLEGPGVDVYETPEEIYTGGRADDQAKGYRKAFPDKPSTIVKRDPKGRCKTKDLAEFFEATVGSERVFIVPVKSLEVAYVLFTRGDEGAIRYAFWNAYARPSLERGVPTRLEWRALRWAIDATTLVKNHFTEVSEGTMLVANAERDKLIVMVRAAWGLKPGLTCFDELARTMLRVHFAKRGSLLLKRDQRHAVLWVRFSGKKGGPHPQHDTSYTGLRQLIGLCKRQNLGIILAGDQAWDDCHKHKLAELAKAYEEWGFLDLTAIWEDYHWNAALSLLAVEPRLRHVKGRIAQLGMLDYLNRKTKGLVHLGFRSGNLEAYSLIGHRVYYMEEKDNQEEKRMKAWHTNKKKGTNKFRGPRYDRIVIDLPPTRTGKLIVTTLRNSKDKTHRDNLIAPWAPKVLGKRPPTDEERKKLKADALDQAKIKGASHFDENDLDVIENVLNQAAKDEMVVDRDGVTQWEAKVLGTG